MLKRKLAGRLSVIAGAIALSCVAAVQPASAALYNFGYLGTQVQVDTKPGNGAPGWVWAYGSSSSWTSGGSINVEYKDGTVESFGVNANSTIARSTTRPISAVQPCTFRTDNWSWECGNYYMVG